jgi:regulatory protein
MDEKKKKQVALSLAYQYLKYRSRTVWEVQKHLQKKAPLYHFSEALIDDTLTYLLSLHLLDDMVFIGEFVRSRNAIKPKGLRALRQELRRYGVSDADIDAYFSKHPPDEDLLAAKVLRPKLKTLSHVSDERKRFQKAMQFMQRRGFSFDCAKEAYRMATEPAS